MTRFEKIDETDLNEAELMVFNKSSSLIEKFSRILVEEKVNPIIAGTTLIRMLNDLFSLSLENGDYIDASFYRENIRAFLKQWDQKTVEKYRQPTAET